MAMIEGKVAVVTGGGSGIGGFGVSAHYPMLMALAATVSLG